jgi:peptidoglycan/xylan/chitin deacetylase (PgdA/CDA1 family)
MMVKSLVRSCLAATCANLGMVDRAENRPGRGLTVLCYHRILPPREKSAYLNPDLAVSPEGFKAHCEALAARYEVRPLSEAADMLRKGAVGKRPLAAVTFDDGYRDNLKFAVPVLDGLGLKATFFVVSGLVGSSESPWYDRLGRAVSRLAQAGRLEEALGLAGKTIDARAARSPGGIVQAAKRLSSPERKAFIATMESIAGPDDPDEGLDLIMDWGQLRALAGAGHEVGSHTVSHEILPGLGDAAVEAEIRESKKSLEGGLGTAVRSFCYPNGDLDGRCLRALEASGYSYACTTRSGDNPAGFAPFEMKRRFICEERLQGPAGGFSESLFRLEISGLADDLFRRGRMKGKTA